MFGFGFRFIFVIVFIFFSCKIKIFGYFVEDVNVVVGFIESFLVGVLGVDSDISKGVDINGFVGGESVVDEEIIGRICFVGVVFIVEFVSNFVRVVFVDFVVFDVVGGGICFV